MVTAGQTSYKEWIPSGEEALQPSALLFDYGGTLDADGLTWRDRFWRIYQAAGLAVDEPRFCAAFFHADDTLPERFAVAGLGFRETLDRQVGLCCDHLGWGDAGTRARIATAFEAEACAAVAASRTLLARLRRQYRIGVVSNFYGNLTRVLADVGLSAVVDVVVDSGVVGVKKPDARLFHAALDPLGVAPADALMIGDSLERDMAGARAMGMPHVLLAGIDAEGRRPCCPDDGRIARLADLEAWLAAGSGPRE